MHPSMPPPKKETSDAMQSFKDYWGWYIGMTLALAGVVLGVEEKGVQYGTIVLLVYFAVCVIRRIMGKDD